MKIVFLNINELKEYKNNPRKNEPAVEAVKESIKEFGFKVPLVVDKAGEIIAGHTRLHAAKKLNYKEVPCIIADDLTPEQIRAFRVIDNKTSQLATWDIEKKEKEIEEILNIDMEKFGFDKFEATLAAGMNAVENLSDNEEIEIDDFDDDKFRYECKECGFKW